MMISVLVDLAVIRYTGFVNYRHTGEGRYPVLLFKMQLGFVPQCGACWINWIPAFAGMTRW
jgi:hypothetical protein